MTRILRSFKAKTMAVIGYIRVSTDKQTYKHQRFEIEEYAKK